MMKIYHRQLIKHSLKALMLVVLTSLCAWQASAQTYDAITSPGGTKYPGNADVFNYTASGFEAGTSFFLYYTTSGTNLEEENVLGMSTTQGSSTTINFNWPEENGAINLIFAAFSGNTFSVEDTQIEDNTLMVFGASSGDGYSGNGINMYKSGPRHATTPVVDLSNTQGTVKLAVYLTDDGDLDSSSPVVVQYTTDSGQNYETLTINALTVGGSTPSVSDEDIHDFDGSGSFYFNLPAGALTDKTQFRILQQNTDNLSINQKTWSIDDLRIYEGDEYTLDAAGIGSNTSVIIDKPSINILSVKDSQGNTVTLASSVFAGDELTIEAELLNVELDDYNFAAMLKTTEEQYELSDANITKDNTSKLISITGNVPLDVVYEIHDFSVYAYDENATKIESGIMEIADFTVGGTIDDFTNMGGEENGANGILYADAGDRSLAFPPINIPSKEDANIALTLARQKNQISPVGTELIVEGSVNGGAFVSVGTISLNQISFVGNGTTKIELPGEEWLNDISGSSTVLRVRQDSNNGTDLDGWYIKKAEIVAQSNVISDGIIGMATPQSVTISRPVITQNNLTLSEIPYPMVDLTFTYTIDNGQFPANTGAKLMLDKLGSGSEFDLILGTIDDITTGSIDFKVPAVSEGDYTLYLLTDNGEEYNAGINLPVYNVGLAIGEINFTNPVNILDEDYGTPGDNVEVSYTLDGMPGSGAELVLSVWDDATDEYVMIAMSTDFSSGKISATLPTDIDYGSSPSLQLSISSGVFSTTLSESLFNYQYIGNDLPEEVFESSVGVENVWYGADFAGEGERSATSKAFDFSQGGTLQVNLRSNGHSSFPDEYPYTVKLQGSTDGTNWEDLEDFTFTSGYQAIYKNISLTNEMWSDQFQFRVIQENEYEENHNVWYFYYLGISRPAFIETAEDTKLFNLVKPSINVAAFDKTSFSIGETVDIAYNAQHFPAGTEYAAVIENNSEYFVAGTSNTQNASSISATMPIMPVDPEMPTDDIYSLKIIPFMPASPGDAYFQGVSTVLDLDDDFASFTGGTSSTSSGLMFTFDKAGQRSLVTRSFDLSGVESATLEFYFNKSYSHIDPSTNKNAVPRLEASTNGVDYTVIPVYELAEGEEQIYDDGLLYLSQTMEVDIPEAYLAENVQFRWTQPLNLGNNKSKWRISDVKLTVDGSNTLSSSLYDVTPNSTTITVNKPLISHYTWEQNDKNDPVFNGEAFDYFWGLNPEKINHTLFPTGTSYTFSINALDPETGENLIIGTTDVFGVFTTSVPSYLPNMTYDVMLTATVEIDGEDYMIFDEEEVGSLEVFLQVIKTTYNGDENAKIYAGDEATFSYEIVNDATAQDDAFYSQLYYNLIVENAYNGQDFILATQQGIGTDFTVTLPPFVQSGSKTFVVKGSEGAPLGDAGTFIGQDRVENLLNNTDDNFFNFDGYMSSTLGGYFFSATSGRRELVTTDFDVSEAKTIEFELDFNREADELAANETFTFEYSTDGGVTYTTMAEYPRLVDEGGDISFKRMVFILPTEAQTAQTRFRWVQKEAEGTIILDDIKIGYTAEFPFETVGESLALNKQNIEITNFSTNTTCANDAITINYEVKGGFGDNASITVYYQSPNNTGFDTENTNYIYPLGTGSTGSLDFTLPAEFFEDYGYSNKDVQFRLYVRDETYTNTKGIKANFYSNIGTYSAARVEFISPINLDASFTLDDQLECSPSDIFATISSPQDYFTYQLVNKATGEDVGPAVTYDPETGNNSINLGVLADPVKLQLKVTSGSADGNTTCNTITSTVTRELQVNPQYGLYRTRNSSLIVPSASLPGSSYVASNGETETICDGSSHINLRAGRIESNSSSVSYASSVEWFRDNLATPVGFGQTLSNFDQSGDYFARVTDGTCTYETGSITINVVEAPERPEVTVVSGDLLFCEGEGEVVLEAPEGFAYYKWSNGAGTRTITVDEAGEYSVQVANTPMDAGGCTSPSSVPVVIETANAPEFTVRTSTGSTSGNYTTINEGVILEACESRPIYFFENGNYSNNGTIVITKDGAEYASTTSASFTITESGVYSAEWRNNDLTLTCTRSIGNFTVTIHEQPTGTPTLTATGNLEFCAGEGTVTLTAPEGFSNYHWMRNGSSISSNTPGFSATSNTLEVSTGGNYSVQVGNAANCYGPVSNFVTLTVRSLPTGPSSVSQVASSCGEGSVTFKFNGSESYRYQLINANTGQPSGNAVGGASGARITSAAIAENTPFYFEVSYADGSGCVFYDENVTYTGKVNNVSLELDGNTLEAKVSSFYNVEEIRWYRNDVLIKNKTGEYSISITDAAQYKIEVDFKGAGICTQSSNSIDLGGSAPAGRHSGRIAANTYPNPSQDELNIDIEGDNFGAYKVDIMSLAGQVLISHELNKQLEDFSEKISIQKLERGIYNLHISKDGQSKNFRIVKN